MLLITCEHGGNEVPAEYAHLFAACRDVLATHRGYDPGALELARRLAARFEAPLFFETTTRLLVELNRSRHHRSLFSEFVQSLSRDERARLLTERYEPYRTAVEAHIAAEVRAGRRVLHVSVHSFTPHLNGTDRRADVGFLYDPRRLPERVFCRTWRQTLRSLRPDLRVRLNYPYRGKADGFTTYLRSRFAAEQYAGIELEVNQRWPLGDPSAWDQLQASLIESQAAAQSMAKLEK